MWRVAVGQEGPGAEGERPAGVIQRGRLGPLGVRLTQHGGLFALLVLVGHFSVASLDAVFLHGERPVDLQGDVSFSKRFSKEQHVGRPGRHGRRTHIVQFEVEAAGVAHRLPAGVASPQRCCARVTVGAQCACSLTDNLKHRGHEQDSSLILKIMN